MKQYIETKTELATRAGVSVPTITKWQGRTGFPKRCKQGWKLSDFDAFAKLALADAVKHQTGTDADLKREKLRKQIELLDVQIIAARRADAIEAKDYIRVDEHRKDILEYVSLVRQAILSWQRSAAARCPEISIPQWEALRDLSDALFDQLNDAIGATSPEIAAAGDTLGRLVAEQWERSKAQ